MLVTAIILVLLVAFIALFRLQDNLMHYIQNFNDTLAAAPTNEAPAKKEAKTVSVQGFMPQAA